MLKKYSALSLMLPCLLLGEVKLAEINVIEQMQRDTNIMEIDLVANELRQSNSVFDVFKKESSIALAGGGSSNAKRVYLRGIESTNLNISLDGAKQGTNIFQHRGNELGLNPDLLKAVEVNTASDASQSSALGGSIVMTTKDAQDFATSGKTTGGIVKIGHHTNTESNRASLTAYSVIDDHYGIVASASGTNNNNYTDGNDNKMLGTAYEDRDYLLKFSLLDLNNHDFRLSFNQNSNDGDMQWGKTGSDKGIVTDPSLLENIVSTTTNYSLQHNYSTGKLLNLETNINLTNILVDRKDSNLEYENDKVGIKVQNHLYLDTSDTKNKISVGFQIEDEETTGVYSCSSKDGGSDCNINTYAPTASNNKALFIQNKTTIGNLNIHYGLRFDDYEFETGFGKATDSTYSPNVGLDYKINDSSKIYANYGKSSRMTGSIPFTWMTNVKKDTSYSSDLKAEKSTNYELGYNHTQGDLFTNNDVFRLDANIFKREFKDLIFSSAVDGYSGEGGRTLDDIYNNDYKFYSKGFELKGSYFMNDYFGSLSYTQIDTNVIDELTTGAAKEPLALRRVGSYDNKQFVLNMGREVMSGLSADYTLTAVAGIDNADQVIRGGYTTHDMSMMYKSSDTSAWTYYAAVNNITDKYYAPSSTLVANDGTYRRDMGRDFRFNIKYEF